MERWELSDAEPFGNGGVGYVYRARLRTDQAVVLKVEPAAPAWTPDAVDRALVVWARAGLAPRVIATHDDGRTLLLELVSPGTQLGALTRASEQSFAVVADTARKLRAARRSSTDAFFPTISEHAEAEGQGNILRAGDGWVVIDPKPVLADPHAECFALLAASEYVTDSAVLERYAQAAEMPDPRLLARWVRIRALITTAQRAESAEPTSDSAQWDAHLQALARMLEPMSR
jgi:streptomycin 6-kinase